MDLFSEVRKGIDRHHKNRELVMGKIKKCLLQGQEVHISLETKVELYES